MNSKLTDEGRVAERRKDERVPLDIPCFIRLTVSGGESYVVMLSNLSRSGLQADLPPSLGPKEIPGNARVSLCDFPKGMEVLEQSTGKVIWVTSGYCGVQFDSPLDDAEATAVLSIIQ